ncbi:MAG: DNA polymerase IV [Kiritimatiellae bacterium]|nr:DNA polymerase IV [Kiritimatiellia bacterium]
MNPSAPIMLESFPQAILHFDGDAFFTSVEQSLHPRYRNKPVVTGAERGIIACASYEAKKLGIKRGVALHEARRICPALIVLPSDYETYSMMSKRMFEILRRWTPIVEEHSIDEGFADLTGMRRFHRCSYEQMGRDIQAAIGAELGLTVSIGISLSKGLAKLCSKYRKPNGFTAVRGRHIHLFLQRHALKEVWGFGKNTVAFLEKFGLCTAYDFIMQPEKWVAKNLTQTQVEIWHELRGKSIHPVSTEEKTDYATVSKCKTFTAPSADFDFVWAKLVRNLESAFIKLRRHRLKAKQLLVALRFRDYQQAGMEAELNRATSVPAEAIPLLREMFETLFKPGEEYRATMVSLGKISTDRREQLDLFEDRVRIEKLEASARVIDKIAEEFGKHKLTQGSALFLQHHPTTARDEQPWRKTHLLPGETARQRINLPMFETR